jgi:hypothetical protein
MIFIKKLYLRGRQNLNAFLLVKIGELLLDKPPKGVEPLTC